MKDGYIPVDVEGKIQFKPISLEKLKILQVEDKIISPCCDDMQDYWWSLDAGDIAAHDGWTKCLWCDSKLTDEQMKVLKEFDYER